VIPVDGRRRGEETSRKTVITVLRIEGSFSMPKILNSLPKYRHHKASGQAIVHLKGKDIYLGPYNSPASHTLYDRLVAEWLVEGRNSSRQSEPVPLSQSMNELILDYIEFAKTYYVADGVPTDEVRRIRDALRPVHRLYGETDANQFGPLALKAVRKTWIDAGLTRSTITYRVAKIKRFFRWAAENERIPVTIFESIKTVSGLRAGRDGVREGRKVIPVTQQQIEATLPYVSAPIRTMIEIGFLTGLRPGEIMEMRPAEILQQGSIWIYRPRRHKTQTHGVCREVPLGPKTQALLAPYLDRGQEEYLFSPQDSIEAHRSKRRAGRQTPMTPSQLNRTAKKTPKRAARKKYDKNSFRTAVNRACKLAKIVPWHPNQLRHAAATRVRQVAGVELAKCLLGHTSIRTTEIYAERDQDALSAFMLQHA
jgi:integrase